MKELKKIKWKAIDDDDFIAYTGDYCLRVEQMRKSEWWFAVYYKDESIFINIQSAFNEQHAKDLAEIHYKAHQLEKELQALKGAVSRFLYKWKEAIMPKKFHWQFHKSIDDLKIMIDYPDKKANIPTK